MIEIALMALVQAVIEAPFTDDAEELRQMNVALAAVLNRYANDAGIKYVRVSFRQVMEGDRTMFVGIGFVDIEKEKTDE